MHANKLLIICGPTATGKTSLGIRLAKKLKGEIVSADSRQIYRDMDIGTGKGLPKNSTFKIQHSKFKEFTIGTYKINSVPIWGYDLVEPNQEFSVGQYSKIAKQIIKDIWNRNKLSIIVGGTGLYIKSLTQPLSNISIPPNKKLRSKLAALSVKELQQKLNALNPRKLSIMNRSDKHNPRRLIRAIELETFNKPISNTNLNTKFQSDQLWIGLAASKQFLNKLVKQNVRQRIDSGFTQEIDKFEKQKFNWNSQAATSTGYKLWKQYLDGNITKSQATDKWILSETQYQTRQLTWFNKLPQIKWLDISMDDWQSQVEPLIQPWYSKSSVNQD